jgi:hypothetical protein
MTKRKEECWCENIFISLILNEEARDGNVQDLFLVHRVTAQMALTLQAKIDCCKGAIVHASSSGGLPTKSNSAPSNSLQL